MARSKIVAIELQNIMTIKEARLEFDERGIISLVGYNDSGKSAGVFGLETFLYDAHKRDQTDMITDGEETGAIGFEFDDGVEINKYKSRSTPSVWEMKRDGQLVYTNDLPAGIAAIDGVPSIIADYLGAVEDPETGQRLNVRRNSDKLFLIETTGGENYKMLNMVLQSEVLSSANKAITTRRNSLQSEVFAEKSTMDTLIKEVESMLVMDQTDITKLSNSVSDLKETRKRYSYLLDVANQHQLIAELEPAPEIPLVDASRVAELDEMLRLQVLVKAPVYEELPMVDSSRVEALATMMQLAALASQPIPPEIPVLDPERYLAMRDYALAYNTAYKVTQEVKQVTTEYEQITSHLHDLSEVHGFKVCRSCGAVVE